MKATIFLFQLLTSISLFAQHTSVDADQLRTTIRHTYSIAHPKSWEIDTSKTFGMDLFLRSPKTDTLDDFYENLNVFTQDLKGQGYSLLRIGTESESQIKNMVTDVVIIDSKLDSTGSELYYRLSYKGRQGKFALTTVQQYYLKNEIGYALTLTIKSGEEDKYMAAGEKMFASFKIR